MHASILEQSHFHAFCSRIEDSLHHAPYIQPQLLWSLSPETYVALALFTFFTSLFMPELFPESSQQRYPSFTFLSSPSMPQESPESSPQRLQARAWKWFFENFTMIWMHPNPVHEHCFSSNSQKLRYLRSIKCIHSPALKLFVTTFAPLLSSCNHEKFKQHVDVLAAENMLNTV